MLDTGEIQTAEIIQTEVDARHRGDPPEIQTEVDGRSRPRLMLDTAAEPGDTTTLSDGDHLRTMRVVRPGVLVAPRRDAASRALAGAAA